MLKKISTSIVTINKAAYHFRARSLITSPFSSNLHIICVLKNSKRSFTMLSIFLNTSDAHLGEK